MARNLAEANFSPRGNRSVWRCQVLSGLSVIYAGRSRTFHWTVWSHGHDRREPGICLSDDARIPGCSGHSVSKGRTAFRRVEIRSTGLPTPPMQWAVVILDGNYIKTTFLPTLLGVHFPNGSASSYDVLVVNKAATGASRVIFHSQSAPSESLFAKPDQSISLFRIRLDCFLAPSTAGTTILGVAHQGPLLTKADSLSEILARRP